MGRPWRELEAEGVKRCCVTFTDGRRCRRRAAEGSSWCERHRRYMDKEIAKHVRVLREAGFMKKEEEK